MIQVKCKKDKKSISFMAWNVNGLNKKKLQDKEFLKKIKSYKIVCLTETWTKKSSDVSIAGFTNFHIPSTSKCKSKRGRNSGGVIVYISNDIFEGISCVKQENSTIWLELEADYFGWAENLYLANTYCPPHSSIYYNNHLERLELEIVDFLNSGKVVIMGDLNCRIGKEPDYITNDELDSYIPLPNNYNVDENIKERAYCDTQLNINGKHLLETCISNNLRIMNGRFVGDSMGRYTYYSVLGASTIDYGICHKSLLDLIQYFIVLPITEYSDHCQICFSLKCSKLQTKNNQNSEITYEKIPLKASPKWKDWSKQAYIESLTQGENIYKLIEYMNRGYELKPESANKAAEDLTKLIREIAEQAIVLSKPKHNTNNQKRNKLGYDSECHQQKKKLRRLSKQLHSSPNNNNIKLSYLHNKRQYKKLVKSKERKCREEIINDLEQLQSNSPKSYWQLLSKLRNTKNPSDTLVQPPADPLIKHYEELNRMNTDNTQEQSRIIEENRVLEESTSSATMLDKPFTITEVKKGISKLKKNKASGPDQILNEYLIYGKEALCAPITKLFNLSLSSNSFPGIWTEGHITSIFKNGNQMDPNNYRGITILSCLGKLLTALMNHRLYNFLSINKLLNKWQAGFLPNHRTSDQTFILKTLINKYVNHQRKKLYVCFVDFKKAFDLVWHEGLFHKLLKLGIGGKFYSTIKNMYSRCKLRVKTNEGLSHCIQTNNGVRQGDNISPLLFNIYINDLPQICDNDQSKPPSLNSEYVPALLYADDLILLSETAEGLQNSLNLLHNYCTKWKLVVNLNKTNAITIGKGKTPTKTNYKFGDKEIISSTTYKYLGTIINSNGTFTHAKKDLKQKGLKALFSFWKSINPGKMPPINIATKLFDSIVKPIIMYNSEVWGSELPSSLQTEILNDDTISQEKYIKFLNETPCEQLHLKFCKMLLGVQKNTSNLGCRAELGRFPLVLDIYISIVKYWIRLIKLPSDRLVVDALNTNLNIQSEGCFSWTTLVKFILKQGDMEHIWITKNIQNVNQFIKNLKQKLQNKYTEMFLNLINNDKCNTSQNKLRTYRMVKHNHNQENYLSEIKNQNIRAAVAKLRLSSHNLMIERGRHLKLKVEERVCPHCNNSAIHDEFHALMICTKYEMERQILLNKFESQIDNWKNLDDKDRFSIIFKMEQLCVETGIFISNIINE